MPTYEFKCKKCGNRFDVFRGIRDESSEICPICGEKAERIIGTGAAIIFKGNGFYVTDYEHKPSAAKLQSKFFEKSLLKEQTFIRI